LAKCSAVVSVLGEEGGARERESRLAWSKDIDVREIEGS